jgi:hypothetical protein
MHRQTPTAEVGQILFVEKRRERLHSGESRGTQNQWSHGLGLGLGVIAFFALPEGRCLSGADKGFLGRRCVSLTTYHRCFLLTGGNVGAGSIRADHKRGCQKGL